MSFILKEVWLWITIFACISIAVGSFFLVWLILQLPDAYRGVAVFALIICWGIASGYKDYLKAEKSS
jgi:hypothetical protein